MIVICVVYKPDIYIAFLTYVEVLHPVCYFYSGGAMWLQYFYTTFSSLCFVGLCVKQSWCLCCLLQYSTKEFFKIYVSFYFWVGVSEFS